MHECRYSYSHARACKHAHELARVHLCNTDVHARALTRAHVRTSAQTQTCTRLRAYACAARKHVIVPVRVCMRGADVRVRVRGHVRRECVHKRTRTCRHTHGRDSQACRRTQMLALARVSTHSPTRRHPRASCYMQHGCAQTRGGAGASTDARTYTALMWAFVSSRGHASRGCVRIRMQAPAHTHAHVCASTHTRTREQARQHMSSHACTCVQCACTCAISVCTHARAYARTRTKAHSSTDAHTWTRGQVGASMLERSVRTLTQACMLARRACACMHTNLNQRRHTHTIAHACTDVRTRTREHAHRT
jgi:hypothetical protein